MFKEIRKLRKYNIRLTTILNELEFLEDGENMDYDEAIQCLGKAVQIVEQRRETLQRRGRRL